MPRYLLFGGDDRYEPCGGGHDLIDGFNDLDTALLAGSQSGADWWNVLDAATGKVYEPSEPAVPKTPKAPGPAPRSAEEIAREAAEREAEALAAQARDDAFNRRFDEAEEDEIAVRRCKHGGHRPVPDERPARRKGARQMVSCACGQRVYTRQGDSYVRALNPEEVIGSLKRGKR